MAKRKIENYPVMPLRISTKRPYNPEINYDSTNDKYEPVTDQVFNICCYNHDCRYSDPTLGGKLILPLTRAEADYEFLLDMKKAGKSWAFRWTRYLAVRAGGAAAWNRCRENDNDLL